MLDFNQVTIRSHAGTLVRRVSLQVKPGEWYALVGQSGSGKSLLSRSAGQLLPPGLRAEGTITYSGHNLLAASRREMRRLLGCKLAYIFQDFHGAFAPFRTIGQHFDEVIRTHAKRSRNGNRDRIATALESVGLDAGLAARYPFQLSGGQMQRIGIAIALLFSPDVLVADEVTTALDSVTGHHILNLLHEHRQKSGCALLFITHDWRHVRRYADRIAVMKDGEIVESGGKHRVLDHPQHDYTRQLIASAPVLMPRPLLPSGLEVER
ncbi:ATP-binding cassette domain-containing protein [Paenibacillus sp. SYP-B4298]|uniref:ATP-binding cassette domain-containing protein n=1 Tax=Paenibacillus sp. SYP-B4298 TaxID=2996034 RepID=UPI0022DE5075|nr:ABC transporter ATP-binding protein [Paenibacillus sp. SYP-B4298]